MLIVSLYSTHLCLVQCLVSGEYVSRTLKERKKDEFMVLEKSGMTIETYEPKFHA